ncbi:MAG: endonuclease III, partial [Rhodothermales bacterium]
MKRTERARITLEKLREVIPRPQSELEFIDEYQLIVAVILSAQCTDVRVNKVTPSLFAAFPTLEAMAEVTPEQV